MTSLFNGYKCPNLFSNVYTRRNSVFSRFTSGASSSGFSRTAMAKSQPLRSAVSTGSYVRHNRKMFTAGTNATWSSVQLTFSNWRNNGAAEADGPMAFTLTVSVEYNGTIYPVTFGGASTYSLAIGANVTSDSVSGLTLPAGAQFFVNTRCQAAAGTYSWLRGTSVQASFNEGVTAGTNTGLDYTVAGSYGIGATATATVAAGVITAASVGLGGSNYVNGAHVVAWEKLANGTYQQLIIGTATVVSGAVTAISVTSGGSGWTSPTLHICNVYSDFGALQGDCYAPTLVTGVPVSNSAKSLIIIGDSTGLGSGDTTGDQFGNYNAYERALNNTCGFVNISISGLKASDYVAYATKFPKTYSLYTGKATHALIAVGTNDLQALDTAATLEGNINSIASYWRTTGAASVSVATLYPRTTSTDSWATTANQTPIAGFTAGGACDTYNADVRSGTVVSDWGYVDGNILLRDATVTQDWRVDWGAITGDGVHLNPLGIATIVAQSSWPQNFECLRSTPSLSSAVSSAILDLDATVVESYASGQTFANIVTTPADSSLKTDNDVYRGATSSATTDDPTFTGRIGSKAAYFALDGGDFFKFKTPTAFLRSLHKTTGGSSHWFSAVVLLPSLSGHLFNNRQGTPARGVDWNMAIGTSSYLQTGDSGSNATLASAPPTPSTGVFISLIVSHDTTNNLTTFWYSTRTGVSKAQTFVTSTVDQSGDNLIGATNTGFGWLPAGSQLKHFGFGNDYLDNTKAAAIIDLLNTRHGATYA